MSKLFDLNLIKNHSYDDWIFPYLENKYDEHQVNIADEGPVIFQNKDLVINAIFWEPIVKRDMPILKSYYYKDEPYTEKVQKRIHTKIYDNIIKTYPSISKNKLQQELLSSIKIIYNLVSTYLTAYETSIDMFSILETMEVTEFAEVSYVDKDYLNKRNISYVEKELKTNSSNVIKVLSDDKHKDKNAFYPYMKLGLVSSHQIPQVVRAAGTRTDLSDNMLLRAILSSYIDGLDDVTELAIDSNMAKKSVYYNKTLLPKPRYNDRVLQLLASIQEKIYEGDCGSNVYLPFKVTPINKDKLYGKYIKDDNSLVDLNKDNIDTYLHKTVHMRTPFGCKYTNGCCQACAGRLTDYFPKNIVVGIESSTQLMSPVGQLILSSKHFTSTESVLYHLNSEFNNIFRMPKKLNKIYLCPSFKNKDFKFVVLSSDIDNITDLNYVKGKDINYKHFSSLTCLGIATKENEIIKLPVPLIDNNGKGSYPYFSREFLLYIKNNLNSILYDDKYAYIDMSKFNPNNPVMEYIIQNFSMLNYSEKINEYFTSKIINYNNIPRLMRDFTDLVYRKVNVNILHLEIIIRSFLVHSEYDLSVPVIEDINEQVNFMKIFTLIYNRGVGAFLAFQGHKNVFRQGETYFSPRLPSIFDKFITSDEA